MDLRQKDKDRKTGANMEFGVPSGSKVVSAYSASGERLTGTIGAETGVSIFDPVLCELMYKWFCPESGAIIDPFAGGSVRGIVAAELGFNYFGCDLSKRQIEANREQADKICKNIKPVWVSDDSKNILTHAKDQTFDMLFTCPPYGYLEIYSDDPADISNMDYAKFKDAYFEIIKKTCTTLKEDSFAVIVVGEFRNKKTGNYENFISDTVDAFLKAGMGYYNEMILVTAIGSLPLRAGRTFKSTRKIGKTHQNILVFVKGDAKKAAGKCGDFGLKEEAIEPNSNS